MDSEKCDEKYDEKGNDVCEKEEKKSEDINQTSNPEGLDSTGESIEMLESECLEVCPKPSDENVEVGDGDGQGKEKNTESDTPKIDKEVANNVECLVIDDDERSKESDELKETPENMENGEKNEKEIVDKEEKGVNNDEKHDESSEKCDVVEIIEEVENMKEKIGEKDDGNESVNGKEECKTEVEANAGSQVQCCNLHCESGVILFEAPLFVLSYYGCDRRDIVQKVCQDCFDSVCLHYDMLADLAKRKIPLLSAKFPVCKDDVVVMDSVEEIKDQEQVLDKDTIKFVEDNLLSVIEETIEKYDLNYQMLECEKIISDQLDQLEETNKEIYKDIVDMELRLAKRRRLIYKEFEPKLKFMAPLNIPCDQEASMSELSYRERTNRLRPAPSKQNTPPPPPPTTQRKPAPQLSVKQLDSSVSPSSGDVIAVQEVGRDISSLPPSGELVRPKLEAGDYVYMMKSTAYSIWLKGRIVELVGDNKYKVKSVTTYGSAYTKILTGKQLAYLKPSSVIYTVGTRVIAVYHDIESPMKEAFYVGIVAEPPKTLNNFRYLIFFDDGYAQYVNHEKINLVCEASPQVYEDVHPSSREFMKNYIQNYPERPMVRLQPGQLVRIEYNEKWLRARVVEVDCSLVKVVFEGVKRVEYIYRGSNRLEPLFSAFVAAAARKEQGSLSRYRNIGRKVNMPYVQYTQDSEDKQPASKNVAKKSTSKVTDNRPRPPEPHEKLEFPTKGFIKQIKLDIKIQRKTFVPHQCEKICIEWTNFHDADCSGVSPLTIPLYFGFDRLLQKSKSKKTVVYVAPCGRNLRSLEEIHRYLRITKSTMSVDMFDIDYWVNVLDEFYIDEKLCRTSIPDISYGAENVKIPCVNEINHTWPNYMEYSPTRIPQDGVNICLDEDFLVACDCKDDCQDKEKCSCWQLTIEGTRVVNNGVPDYAVGYMYRRLPERVITGIYECNSRCKCSSTCLNRVVQFPMQVNLQIFNTKMKGWGIRSLNDIPHGGFVCTYAGRLHTEQSANEDGRKYGDEYLAELDYIEVVERYKEDYESEVVNPELTSKDAGAGGDGRKNTEQEDEDEPMDEGRIFGKNDDEYKPSAQMKKTADNRNMSVSTRAKYKKTSSTEDVASGGKDGEADKCGEDDEDEPDSEREPLKFTAFVEENKQINNFKSIREMYGDGADECYIMDAKSSGNIGRYLNHSCQPNIFVQNVFVDTHDLRFPWVAFFALTHIKAGTELTWDYNYDVGSVPDKVLYCYCNSAECRGRLI